MKDIYRELMKRSFKDAMWVVEEVEKEYDITIPAESYPKMALMLYQDRIEGRQIRDYQKEKEEMYPDGDPNKGRY